MLIRKMVIAGFVLAAVGLTATVTTVVIGQQPGTTEKSADAAGKIEPTKGEAELAPNLPGGAGDAAPASDDTLPAADGGSSPSADGTETKASAPPAGLGSAPGATPGKPKKREKSSAKTPGSNARSGGGMMMGGIPGMAGMPGMGMPGGGEMGEMMGSSGMMSAPISEDEHLETWVSRALADYARNEDQKARKQQRDEIAKALDRIFDIRQERRMEELETLEQRVQKLRGTLETREKLKADILKNRLDYLTREADGLGWGDGLPAPGRSAPTGFGAGGKARSGFSRGAAGGGYGTGGGPPAAGAGSAADPSRP